jgi:(hydroxyamino)benzene mutase
MAQPNKACTGRWGVCGVFKHFLASSFILLPSIVHVRPSASIPPDGDWPQTVRQGNNTLPIKYNHCEVEGNMNISALLQRQGQRLLQLGMAFFLYSSLDGFVIPVLASPRIGLSVHTLSALQAVMFLAIGLLWSRLNLSPRAAKVAFWCLIYSAVAILAAYTVAAFWGVGIETISLMGELPHGLTHGTFFQETFIKVLAYSSAPTGITAFVLILWGLRITEQNTPA